MAEVVSRHGGEVNKFMGDGIMAVFCDDDAGAAPGDHAARAVRCGLEMIAADTGFRTEVGIHTGDVIAGAIGSAEKLEHAFVGATVNLAARLEELNKGRGTQLLMSEATRDALGGEVPAIDLGAVEIRGKTVPVRVFTAGAARAIACLAAVTALLGTPCHGQRTDLPLGVLLASGPEARLERPGQRKAAPLRPGDLLYDGDRLRAGGSPMTYLYCPARLSQTVDAASELTLQAASVVFEKGKVTVQKSVHACLLPRVARLSPAGQQRLGGLTMREVTGPVLLIGPAGGAVLAERPRFTWERAEGADSYQLALAGPDRVVFWKTTVKGIEVQYPADAPALPEGDRCIWRVTALVAGVRLGAAEAEFETLSAAERQRIVRDLVPDSEGPAAMLTRAAQLERARLVSDAAAEYRRLEGSWPDAAWIKTKLRQLQDRIRSAQKAVEE